MKLNHQALYNILTFFMLTALSMFISAHLQNDFFWDLANYHYYNAWAFLHDRLNYDIVPASINTFFNPLIELPLYFYIKYFNDNIPLIYALQGIWGGFLLFTFFKIYKLFFKTETLNQKFFCALILAISFTGQATYHQLGASTNEIPVSFLILWGLYILLKMIKFPSAQKLYKFLLAGLIMGIALALKQTVITYCVASGLTLIICFKYLQTPIKSILVFALGGLIGFLLLNGYFMYQHWVLYTNPVFPFLNGIFHSPYFDDFNYRDTRFLPSLKTFVIYPFLWFSDKYSITEVPVFHSRLTLLYLILISGAIYFMATKQFRKHYSSKPLQTSLYIFISLSFFLWLALFAILRYAAIIEILSALIFAKIIQKSFLAEKHFFISILPISVILIVSFIPVVSDGWTIRNIDDEQFLHVESVSIPDNSLIKLYNFPTAFVVPFLTNNRPIRALGYMHYNCTFMEGSDFVERGQFRKIRNQIENNHQGPEIIIWFNDTFLKKLPLGTYKKIASNCLQDPPCQLNFCETANRSAQIMLKIPDNYFCRALQNNLDNRIEICVPTELKTQILGEENETNQ